MSLLRLACEMKHINCRVNSRFFLARKTYTGKHYIRTSVVFQSRWKQYLMDMTKLYEDILEQRFPRIYKVYRLFIIGTQGFYRDTKSYMKIRKAVNNGKKISDLARREIDIYYEMPPHLFRVVPIIIVASLPFTSYLILPLLYFFPRQLLSSHFWSLEQRVEFALIYHRKKLVNNRNVFRCLQAQVENIEKEQLKENCQKIFHKLGSGVHPSVEEILKTKEAFGLDPYNLTSLTTGHTTSLCSIHGLSVLGLRKQRLLKHAEMIRYMDIVLKREDIRKLNVDDMRKACFLRGINPIGMQRDDVIQYLEQWISVTDHVTNENTSLLLHCPILLAYNQPTNWSLIH